MRFTDENPPPGAGPRVPVVGWRTWRARPVPPDAVLESPYRGEPWEPGVTHARCRRCPPWLARVHQVPAPSCDCGIYAFSTPEDALLHLVRQAVTLDDRDPLALPVVGAVIGWGRIVQHGLQGWRAEHARPVALLDTGHSLVEAAARYHHVPLVSMAGLRLLAREYGEVLTG